VIRFSKATARRTLWLVLTAAASGAPPLSITSSVPPSGTEGASYFFVFSATGGTPPYAWRANGLPPGLDVNSISGAMAGVPFNGSFGTYTINVFVRDSLMVEIAVQYTIKINLGGLPLGISTAALPNATVGVSYSQTIQASGGLPPYTFNTASTLPAGLTLSPGGVLAGVPTVAGAYQFSVVAFDSTNNQVGAPVSLTVTAPLVITTPFGLPSGSVGTSYSQTFSATGGTPPYNFSIVSVNLPGLAMNPATGVLSGTPTASGVYIVIVRVADSLNVAATKQFQLTIAASGLLQVSPQALSFLSSGGGNAPSPQSISIVSASAGAVSFGVTVDGGTPATPAPAWLSVKPLTGATPARLIVGADTSGLHEGSYHARIRVLVTADSRQTPVDVAVSLTVAAAVPQLGVAPGFLRFAAPAGSPATSAQALVVQNAGGNGSLSFNASVVGGSPWIRVAPAAGQAGPNTPAVLQVQIDSQGLEAGAHDDAIRIASSAGSLDVPVSLFVAGAGTLLGVNQTGVFFEGQALAGISMPQTIQIFNLGDTASAVNWTATLLSGADWLSLGGNANGTATATNPGSLTLTPNASVASLPPGSRYALVRVSDPGALNSPLYVTAVLNIGAASSVAVNDPSPAGLVFTTTGGAPPPPQTVRVYTSSLAPVSLQTAVTTADGTPWLAASPAAAAVSTQSPGQIAVSINAAGLGAGVYTADLNIAVGGVLRTVGVTLIVAPPNCSPTRLVATHTALSNAFSVPAGWPATLAVQLNDDCGAPVLNASVVASFSSGDAPLSLIGDRLTGTYSVTWQPGKAASQMTINAVAVASLLPPVAAQLIGSVNPNAAAAPVLFKNGTRNSANPMSGAALAPGTVARVLGSGLATQTVSPGVAPLTTSFNGTGMLVGAVDAPLYSLSDGRLDVQIPFELAPNRQYQVIASVNGALTLPDTIDVSPVSPGVLTAADGTAVTQHADSTPVDQGHPATRSEMVTIYLSGMGATNPPVPSGQLAPSPGPQATVPAAVTVNGQNAVVPFAGLTPGGIGLYQINFQVPPGAGFGNLDVVVSQGGVAANTAKLPVAP
jgi:uncharacterized protein (TIGR03437 family)